MNSDPQAFPCGKCNCVDGVSPIRGRWVLPGIGETSECPVYHLAPGMHSFNRLVRMYEAGHLPHAGGVLDQPANLLNALDAYHYAGA